MHDVSSQLEQARKELLYLGLRNPLLNYRPLKARGLTIIQESPSTLFQWLVEQQGRAFFTHSDQKTRKRSKERPVKTAHNAADLEKRLHNTYYTARAYIEEQGINILYLALGMLRWRDKETADTIRHAPLILIPITIDRASAKDNYHIRYTGTDIGTNLSLEAKLRLDFGLSLPLIHNVEEEGFDLNDYFAQVNNAVIYDQPGWSVDTTAVTLGFFSFNKFLMYQDLDPAQWPDGTKPDEHPVLESLLTLRGFREPPAVVTPDELIDPHIDLQDSHLVLEADSSQLRAILDVNAGRNLVIQGPPGTGKSQTITNLIAEAVGNDKTVLFVSEKMAALDVVKRKLDQVGLGGAALALHSHTTTKRTFAAEIGRTLALGRPHQSGIFPEIKDLAHSRAHLNSYSHAMNSEIGASGVTPFFGYGRLIELDERLEQATGWSQILRQHLSSAVYSTAAQWDQETYQTRRAVIEEGQKRLTQTGDLTLHPWRDMHGTQECPPETIRSLVQQWQKGLQEQLNALKDVANAIGMPPPETLAQGEKLADIGRRAITAPNLYAVTAGDPAWHQQDDALRTAFDLGTQLAYLRQTYDDILLPEAWSQDVFALRVPLRSGGDKWLRNMSRDYRQARDQLAGFCRTELPESGEERLAIVDAILEYKRLYPEFQRFEPLLQKLFGLRFTGILSPWQELDGVRRWLTALHRDVAEGYLAADLLTYIAEGLTYEERVRIEPVVANLTTSTDAIHQTGNQTIRQLNLPPLNPAVTTYESLIQQLHHYLNGAERYNGIAQFNHYAQNLAELAPWEPIMRQWSHAPTHLLDLFDHVYHMGLIERALLEQQALGGFAGEAQTSAVERFRELDRAFLVHNRSKLADLHWDHLPKYLAGGQIGFLAKEASKKTNHQPIRQTMRQAGFTIQKLKPIFMMSPLSIAMFLPPGEIMFDLVIFDEASQVRPVDAFGALIRGKQAVVVGDSRQLPPTTFFDRVLSDPTSDVADEDEWVSDNESILDLFVAQGAPQQMLHWHYRSQHESLIAISNREFYDNKLVLFPSPDAARSEVGLHLHHNPDTIYERGKSRTNPAEARQVAQEVMRHAAETPHLTLGVATFSSAQREAISAEVEQLRQAQPDHESFFQVHPHEPFFIKNLENVQGDERDVMFLSLGYGRAVDGKVRLNFGPLNSDGGERRLNVLITRSRQRCEIFTNLTADDIDLRRTQAKGVIALKAYLAYAASGTLPELPPNRPRTISPFERIVARTLTDAGYGVTHRVGLGGVEIDLALKDPRSADGRYLLGIEFDGEDYHLAKSARDRDRIQAEVLARLGWQIVRVWSTEWLQNGAAERERLLATITDCLTPKESIEKKADRELQVARYAAAALKERQARPYQRAKLNLGTADDRADLSYGDKKMGDYLLRMVQEEGPIHLEVAMRHLSFEAGHSRSVIYPAFAARIAENLSRAGKIELEDKFLYPVGMRERNAVPVRDWSDLPSPSRKFNYVPPAEIGAAIQLITKDSFSLDIQEIPGLVSQLLGFGHIGRKNKERVVKVLLDLIWEQLLHFDPITQEVRLAHPHETLAELDLSLLEQIKSVLIRKSRSAAKTKIGAEYLTADDLDLPDYVTTDLREKATHPKQAIFFERDGWQHNAIYQTPPDACYTVDKELIMLPGQETMRSSGEHIYDPENDQYTLTALPRNSRQQANWRQLIGSVVNNDSPKIAGQIFHDFRTGRFFVRPSHHLYRRTPRPNAIRRMLETGEFVKINTQDKTGQRCLDRLDLQTYTWHPIPDSYFYYHAPDANWLREVNVSAELEATIRQPELAWLSEILTNEAPIHKKLLVHRFAKAARYARPADWLYDFVEQLLHYAAAQGLVQCHGDFVWRRGDENPVLLRNWQQVPKEHRKLAYVTPEGLAEAIIQLAQTESLALTQKELPHAITHLLGTRAAESSDKKRINFCTKWLQQKGILISDAQGFFDIDQPSSADEPNWRAQFTQDWGQEAAKKPIPLAKDWIIQFSRQWPLYRYAIFNVEKISSWDNVTEPVLDAWVTQVVTQEGPIHIEEVKRRLQMLTHRVTNKLTIFEQAAQRLHDNGTILLADQILTMADAPPLKKPRYRHYFAGSERQMYLVPSAEIETAVRLILESLRAPCPENDLVNYVSQAFFGGRLQGKNQKHIRQIITTMIESKKLLKDGQKIIYTP